MQGVSLAAFALVVPVIALAVKLERQGIAYAAVVAGEKLYGFGVSAVLGLVRAAAGAHEFLGFVVESRPLEASAPYYFDGLAGTWLPSFLHISFFVDAGRKTPGTAQRRFFQFQLFPLLRKRVAADTSL